MSSMNNNAATRAYADRLVGPLNTRITNLSVSFTNTVDVTIVVTVLANFQIKIVLDL